MNETLLYRLKAGEKPSRAQEPDARFCLGVSADGVRVALSLIGPDKKRFVVIDGERGPNVDEVSGLHCDLTGRRVAYVAKTGKQHHAYVDGKVSLPSDQYCYASFSADGRHVAYTTRTKSKSAIVVDGEPRESHHYAFHPIWSPDGTHLAYLTNTGGKVGKHDCVGGTWNVIVDGQPGPSYSDVIKLQYAPDGALLYIANDGPGRQGYSAPGGKAFVVRNGEPGPNFESVNPVIGLVTGGSRLAYLAGEGDEEFAVTDGQPQLRGKRVSELVFSPDATRFGYVVDGAAVIDGKRGQTYEDASGLQFSNDGRHVAYIADQKGDKRSVVLDRAVGPTFTQRSSTELVFSPDGGRLAYVGNDGEDLHVYLDGKQLPRNYDNLWGSVAFSNDGKRFAYYVIRAHKSQWVVDGVDGPPHVYDRSPPVGFLADGGYNPGDSRSVPLMFTPDGSHHAYTGNVGKVACLFVDGQRQDIKLDEVLALGFLPRERCFAALARRKDDYLVLRTDSLRYAD